MSFGAEAIGLCRTEHMFLVDRKQIIQSFILSEDDVVRSAALAQLLEVQTDDFLSIVPNHERQGRRRPFARSTASRVLGDPQREYAVKLEISVGTMIELPRACLVADQIAKHADFFCFGTNDLTQTVFGFSRDDARQSLYPSTCIRGF